MINHEYHIQNKSFSLQNMCVCVCAVYIYYVYINTHTCSIYLENTYILNILTCIFI